ncbi:hypothetical protein ACTXT7_004298 [Hymenolepis weldensis]
MYFFIKLQLVNKTEVFHDSLISTYHLNKEKIVGYKYLNVNSRRKKGTRACKKSQASIGAHLGLAKAFAGPKMLVVSSSEQGGGTRI